MNLSKKLGLKKSRNLKALAKEKLFNKTIQKKLNLFIKDKYSTKNSSTTKLNKKNDLSRKGNNNITLNNSINNIINKIEIVSRNHSNEKKQKYITFEDNISNNHFLTSINSVNNLFSFNTKKNILKKRNQNNCFNDSFNFNSGINKMGRKKSFYDKRITNGNIMIAKINTINARKRYPNLTNNNFSSFNNSINSSINETIKNHMNIISNSNNFEQSLRNKLLYAGKEQIKKRELNKKIQKAVLGINKVLPVNLKLNNIIKINKNKVNLNNTNIIKPNYLSINKNKTFVDMFIKKSKKNNAYLINNNSKISISNNRQIYKINTFNDNKKQNETFLKTIFKEEKNKQSVELKRYKRGSKNIVDKNKYIKLDENISEIKNKICDSSLNKTIGFSNNTTKIEEEGMLEMNDVKDIIIYYNLSKELNKDYLFEKFDYNFFIKKKMNNYFRFFIK